MSGTGRGDGDLSCGGRLGVRTRNRFSPDTSFRMRLLTNFACLPWGKRRIRTYTTGDQSGPLQGLHGAAITILHSFPSGECEVRTHKTETRHTSFPMRPLHQLCITLHGGGLGVRTRNRLTPGSRFQVRLLSNSHVLRTRHWVRTSDLSRVGGTLYRLS